MNKEYKLVKDFEGIFDENQKINLYIFDMEKNSHILGFSGEAGIFYSLINKNAKFGKFYGEFEVLDMFQSSADEGTLIIMCQEHENKLKDKLDSVKPIVEAKNEIKDKVIDEIANLIVAYEEHSDFIKKVFLNGKLSEEDARILGIYEQLKEELMELGRKVKKL